MHKLLPLAVALLGLVGCADMKVTRITTEDRMADKDSHVHGFRYYLSRPYVLVKDNVKVTSETSLVLLKVDQLDDSLKKLLSQDIAAGKDGAVFQMDRASGEFAPVNQKEWERIRQVAVKSADTGGVKLSFAPAPGGANQDRATVVAAQDMGALDVRVGATDRAVMATDIVNDKNKDRARMVGGPASDTLPDVDPPAPPTDKTVNLTGNIQIVFLPDLDEQYAVHARNCMAKSSFGLTFKDGWQLVGVNGDFDSTTVALELLKVIDGAIDTAKSVAITGLNTAAKLKNNRDQVFDGLARQGVDLRDGGVKYVVLEVKRDRVIPPGLYRINKPWEMQQGVMPTGAGLLAKMGLNPIEVVTITKAEALTVR